MALRLIELYLPATQDISKLKEQLADFSVLAIWEDNNTETRSQLRIMADSGDTGEILDYLEKRFSSVKGFRIVLLAVEATLPRIEPKKQNPRKNPKKKNGSSG